MSSGPSLDSVVNIKFSDADFLAHGPVTDRATPVHCIQMGQLVTH
jgi:hypothetical protein